MDNRSNFNYLTLDGYVEVEKYRYLYLVIIFTVYVLVLCCNSCVIFLIVIHQNLHEPMYIFIAALLMNSHLVSSAIYPKLLIDVMSKKQIISHSMCHFQFFIFYTSSGAEFLLLAAMAYDRYVSICKPLQYPTIMTKTTVWALLVLAWLFPACLVSGSTSLSANQAVCNFTLRGIFCNNSVLKVHCVTSTTLFMYGAIIMICRVILPLLFIIFTYSKILIISYCGGKAVRAKTMQTCLPHLLVLFNFSLFCSFDIILVRLESDVSKTARLIMTLQLVLYHPLFNPIIYGVKMKEISKRLQRLLYRVK